MTSQETTKSLACSLQPQHFVCVALLVLFLGQLLAGRVYGAEDAADPYDTLYDAIMLRQSVDGEVRGHDEVTPLIYGRSEFPFDPTSYKKLDAALHAFESLP